MKLRFLLPFLLGGVCGCVLNWWYFYDNYADRVLEATDWGFAAFFLPFVISVAIPPLVLLICRQCRWPALEHCWLWVVVCFVISYIPSFALWLGPAYFGADL